MRDMKENKQLRREKSELGGEGRRLAQLWNHVPVRHGDKAVISSAQLVSRKAINMRRRRGQLTGPIPTIIQESHYG